MFNFKRLQFKFKIYSYFFYINLKKFSNYIYMKYQLTLDFLDIEHIQQWFNEQKEFEAYKLKKSLKKEIGTDPRGNHMEGFHKEAKEYRILHPELTYKEAMKEIIKSKKLEKKE